MSSSENCKKIRKKLKQVGRIAGLLNLGFVLVCIDRRA